MRRTVLSFLVCFVALAALAIFVDRRADLREASFEAKYPPEGEIVTIDGRAVHVVVEGTGPDLVLIHGAGGSARDWPPALVDQLTQRVRVFRVDRPGFGYTEMRHDLNTGWSAEAEPPREQAALLARAARQLGAETPIVVGHSFGGAVAMGWALDEPASAVVILSGATMPWPGDVDWTYRLLGSRLGGAVLAPLVTAFLPESYVRNTLENVFKPQPAPDDYFSRAGVMMAVRTATLRANNRQVNTLRAEVVRMTLEYPNITLPVEIIHGTADKTVFLEVHAEPLNRTLPNAALTELEGMGHMPQHYAIDGVIAAVERAATRAGLR